VRGRARRCARTRLLRKIMGIKITLKSVGGRIPGLTGIYSRRFRSMMTVVAFHRVNDQLPEHGITCGSAKFESFCRFFRRYFDVMPLSEQIAALHSDADLGGTLAITFDDGYLDNFEVPAPILRRMGLPAIFFVTSSFVGSQTVARWDRQPTQPPGWMSWDQVRTLASQGFEIGNHTDTHIDLAAAVRHVSAALTLRNQTRSI
jgi:hypothetical protein